MADKQRKGKSMSTIKERISNVIAWGGFLFLIGTLSLGLLVFMIEQDGDVLISAPIVAVAGWIGAGVVNYLLCGDMRLQPKNKPKG